MAVDILDETGSNSNIVEAREISDHLVSKGYGKIDVLKKELVDWMDIAVREEEEKIKLQLRIKILEKE